MPPLLKSPLSVIAFLFVSVFIFVGIPNIITYYDTHKFGYKHEDGVDTSGTLIDYRYRVHSRTSTAVAKIDGKLTPVATWVISYIDNNGRFGVCNYYTVRGTHLHRGEHIVCSKGKLIFN